MADATNYLSTEKKLVHNMLILCLDTHIATTKIKYSGWKGSSQMLLASIIQRALEVDWIFLGGLAPNKLLILPKARFYFAFAVSAVYLVFRSSMGQEY